MTPAADRGPEARAIASVTAWRGRFADLDAIVVEFGVDGLDVPPLLVPTASVDRLVAVLLEAAESPVRPAPPIRRHAVPGGPTWARLLAQPRCAASSVPDADVPAQPGVYAWLCDGGPVYLGRAKSRRGLRARVVGDRLPEETRLREGSFRAAVADHLGLARAGEDALAPDELGRLNAWIACCEVTWLACADASEAADLEAVLRAEGDVAFPDA